MGRVKTGESLKREFFFGEVHFMITKMKQNELWAILLLSGSSFNSEAPKNWEPLSLTWIYPVRTGASELKESLWAASDSQKMLHFKTCSLRLHSREQGEMSRLAETFFLTAPLGPDFFLKLGSTSAGCKSALKTLYPPLPYIFWKLWTCSFTRYRPIYVIPMEKIE